MSIRNVLLLVAVLLIAIFVAANWQQFTAPVEMDLIVQEFEAPFGLAMLVVLGAFGLLFLVSVGGIRTGALKNKLHAAKEIEAAHKAVAKTEGDRLDRLESLVRAKTDALDRKLDRIANRIGASEPLHNRREEPQKKRPVSAGMV